MGKVDFKNAYYVKLGRGGAWEENSINEGKLRIGWNEIAREDFDTINWPRIEKDIRDSFSDQGAATRDINALRNLVNSDPSVVWITFHNSMLWWCKLKGTGVKHDAVSNYLELDGVWSNADTSGRILYTNQLPGSISKIQGFRAAVCKVWEVSTLRRVINAEASPQYAAVVEAKKALIGNMAAIIKDLHWKDFELLVDLVFRQSGWKRVSMLGENMKYADIELEDSINGYRYQVQVKSSASLRNFNSYRGQFDGTAFDRLFYVVHSPDASLRGHESDGDDVKLILPEQLAAMVVDTGLIEWVLERAK